MSVEGVQSLHFVAIIVTIQKDSKKIKKKKYISNY